jgi:hypothetical protein
MGRFAIEFWGVEAAVEWDDPRFDQSAGDLLLPIWAHDPDLVPDAVFRLVTDAAGETSVQSPAQELYTMLKDDVVETLERRLHLYLGANTRQVVFVHAGVVQWNGMAILFPGRSYAGKTTLIQALVLAGAAFLSDEYAIVDPNGMVHPFPRPISLREPEGIRRIKASELGWDGRVKPLPVGAVIVTSYQKDATWKPEEISPGSAVLELMGNTVSAQAAPQLALACLSKAVAKTRCWKGPRGEAETTAELLLRQLSGQHAPRA